MLQKSRLVKGPRLLPVMFVTAISVLSSSTAQEQSPLTVDQIMKDIIAPTTAKIWGAYEIKTDGQWQELENAALAVVAAGELLKTAGVNAQEQDWQSYNDQMIVAAQAAISAIKEKNEEALFNAGNDQLYPPCESCHQKYMAQ